jgi:hypothetical protein
MGAAAALRATEIVDLREYVTVCFEKFSVWRQRQVSDLSVSIL